MGRAAALVLASRWHRPCVAPGERGQAAAGGCAATAAQVACNFQGLVFAARPERSGFGLQRALAVVPKVLTLGGPARGGCSILRRGRAVPGTPWRAGASATPGQTRAGFPTVLQGPY